MSRAEVPAIITAHHAGNSFDVGTLLGNPLPERVNLSPEQQIRFSDYGTDETSPKNGVATLISTHSRGIGNLNTEPWNLEKLFAEKDFGKPTPNNVWLPGYELSNEEKSILRREIYEPYHLDILSYIRAFKEDGIVVAWDNTADYVIGKDGDGIDTIMPDIVLSNRGAEGQASGDGKEVTSCDPQLLLTFGFELKRELERKGIIVEIEYNLIYYGGYIASQYSTDRNPIALDTDRRVQAFQLEYNTKLTHDQETLKPYPGKIDAFRQASEIALRNSAKFLSS